MVKEVQSISGATYGHLSVAYLHDVIEDTNWKLSDLEALGISSTVAHDVAMLTRTKGETYFDYIRRLKHQGTTRAIDVKIADLRVNIKTGLGDERYAGLRLRYRDALAILEGHG